MLDLYSSTSDPVLGRRWLITVGDQPYLALVESGWLLFDDKFRSGMLILSLAVLKMDDYRMDHTVADAAALGEPTSFQLIYNTYLPLIKHVWCAFRIDGLEYEDWCQESRIVILKVLDHYHEHEQYKFGALLKLSLLRRANDLHRQRDSLKRIPQDALVSTEDITELLMLNSGDDDVEQIVESRMGFRNFWSSCSVFERRVFAGIHCGQTVDDLAHRFGCRPKAVQNAMCRCKKKMIKVLRS